MFLRSAIDTTTGTFPVPEPTLYGEILSVDYGPGPSAPAPASQADTTSKTLLILAALALLGMGYALTRR